MEFTPESPNITLLAAALDPRFRNLKFLPAAQGFKVQSTIQTMALAVAAKKQVRQPLQVKMEHPAQHTTPQKCMPRHVIPQHTGIRLQH
ncbi:hypothetical protein QQF64_023814 [Cirrhinus molitorella]|uniref:Uncharacterized protein n=1 Tax=Cirrhinus molitorella TaxID=172907 RepID=A0ABR3NK12_9TELE